jgi:transposase
VQNTFDLLNLSGWRVIACEESEDRYVIQATPCCPRSSCPACGSIRASKHGSDAQTLHDLPCHGKRVTIRVNRQRYRCVACRKTWFEALPEVDERYFATARLVRYVQRQALTRPFVAVAAETGIDEKTARLWFHDSIADLEQATPRSTPQVLGLDEIYLLGQPRAVFTDLKARKVVEMLPERKKEVILRYLAALPEKDRIAIQICVIDMHRPYLEAFITHLPHATIVIDKFHVLKQLGETVERMRKEVRASLSDRARRGLMHDRFLLHKRHKDLTAQQLLILESWLGQFPRLSAVYWRKEDFYKVYEARTHEDALVCYAEWCRSIEENQVTDAFQDFLGTVERWKTFIFNYFIHRYTGGPVEGLNSLIRSVDRAGNSLSFAVLRAKILYGQHLLRQTRRAKPKADDVLDVGSLLSDTVESTFTQLPLPL